MFFQERLIISYIQEPEQNKYLFQLAGGEEMPISEQEFRKHWQIYRRFEADRASQITEHYRPLPITMEIRHSINVLPVNMSLRRGKHTA